MTPNFIRTLASQAGQSTLPRRDKKSVGGPLPSEDCSKLEQASVGTSPAPDGPFCWFIAALAFVVSLLYSSFFRCSSLFFASILSTYGATRAEAAIPFAIYGGIANLSSLPAGALIQAFGVRRATALGGILISAGCLASAFATGVPFLVFSIGILAGSGHGVLLPCLIVLINQYFRKRRGAALGLNLAGSSTASLFFTNIYEWSLAEYGLKTTLALAGATMLNIPVLSVFFRKPLWADANVQTNNAWTHHGMCLPGDDEGRSVTLNAYSRGADNTSELSYAPFSVAQGAALNALQTTSKTWAEAPAPSANSVFSVSNGLIKAPQGVQFVESDKNDTRLQTSELKPFPITETVLGVTNLQDDLKREKYFPAESEKMNGHACLKNVGTTSGFVKFTQINNCSDVQDCDPSFGELAHSCGFEAETGTSARNHLYPVTITQRNSVTRGNSVKSHEINKHAEIVLPVASLTVTLRRFSSEETSAAHANSRSILSSFKQVLSMPRFYIHVLGYLSYTFFLDTMMSIMVDCAMDVGVSAASATHIVTLFSVTDTVGRLLIPLLTDHGLLAPFSLMTVSYFGMAVIGIAAPFVKVKIAFSVLLVLLGLPMGYVMVALPQIISTEVGLRNLPIAYGVAAGVTSGGAFVAPLVIGFFRDRKGSYDGLLQLMGGTIFFSFLLCLFLGLRTQFIERRSAVSSVKENKK